jgi:hypothetical protein
MWYVAMNPKQKEIYRQMTPAQKLDIAAQMWWEAKKLKAAALRTRHPDWSEEEIQKKVKEIFLYAST